jgi:hypothetical protein
MRHRRKDEKMIPRERGLHKPCGSIIPLDSENDLEDKVAGWLTFTISVLWTY